MNWRPDDWEPLDCEKCQCRESRCETWCTLYRTYEDAADAMLVARDKWWIKTVDALISAPPCFGETDEICSALSCEDYPCTLVRWHQLKASLVVK